MKQTSKLEVKINAETIAWNVPMIIAMIQQAIIIGRVGFQTMIESMYIT